MDEQSKPALSINRRQFLRTALLTGSVAMVAAAVPGAAFASTTAGSRGTGHRPQDGAAQPDAGHRARRHAGQVHRGPALESVYRHRQPPDRAHSSCASRWPSTAPSRTR